MRAAIVIALVFALVPASFAQTRDEIVPGPLPERDATLRDFMFYDYSREIHKLYEHRGKPVVLVFWTPADENSLNALRMLASLSEEEENTDVVFYAVEISGQTGDALMHLARNEYPFTFLEGDYGFLAKRYGISGVPTIFVVDTLSRLEMAFLGVDGTTPEKIRSALKSARGR